MKLIHDGGYSREERESFKEIIFSNTIQSMRVILEAMDSLEIPLYLEENQEFANVILEQPGQIEADMLPPKVSEAVKLLWKDQGVIMCFNRSNEYQLNDSAK